jgi:hypothetical protein
MSLTQTDVIVVELGARSDVMHVNKASCTTLLDACLALARDLRELHDRTGISLDKWKSARTFVEAFTGPVEDNNA